MTPYVAVAVLCAAIAHATWNAIAHGIRDQLLAFTLVGTGSALCGLLMLPFTPLPASAAWPYLLFSGLLHTVYQTLLMRSFRVGEFGQMYPIARGTSPLVVTVLAAVFVGERPDGWQMAGILLASTGLVGVALWGIRGSGTSLRSNGPALALAVSTGLAIASYTVVDGVGVRNSGSAAGYVGWLMMFQGLPIPAYAALARRSTLRIEMRPVALRGLLGGALSVLAYGLVLWAQTRGELAPIAALRESSIIVGAAIGTVFFKERFGGPRIAAASLLVAGIGLMLHSG